MDLQLKDKKALVTGSTVGIGFAIARALINEGVEVIINGRDEKRVQAALKELGTNAKGIVADLGTVEGADKLFLAFPKIDILINNLGIYEVKPFEEITDQDWMRIFEINVLSGIRLSRFYLPFMKENDWGRILFISSESGINIPKEMIHYGLTKTAQLSISRGLAQTCTGTGVTVNSLLPGPTYSEGVEKFINDIAEQEQQDPEITKRDFFNKMRPSSIIQRFADTKEVADVAAFLCSPLASAITGAAIRVEGGVISTIY